MKDHCLHCRLWPMPQHMLKGTAELKLDPPPPRHLPKSSAVLFLWPGLTFEVLQGTRMVATLALHQSARTVMRISRRRTFVTATVCFSWHSSGTCLSRQACMGSRCQLQPQSMRYAHSVQRRWIRRCTKLSAPRVAYRVKSPSVILWWKQKQLFRDLVIYLKS